MTLFHHPRTTMLDDALESRDVEQWDSDDEKQETKRVVWWKRFGNEPVPVINGGFVFFTLVWMLTNFTAMSFFYGAGKPHWSVDAVVRVTVFLVLFTSYRWIRARFFASDARRQAEAVLRHWAGRRFRDCRCGACGYSLASAVADVRAHHGENVFNPALPVSAHVLCSECGARWFPWRLTQTRDAAVGTGKGHLHVDDRHTAVMCGYFDAVVADKYPVSAETTPARLYKLVVRRRRWALLWTACAFVFGSALALAYSFRTNGGRPEPFAWVLTFFVMSVIAIVVYAVMQRLPARLRIRIIVAAGGCPACGERLTASPRDADGCKRCTKCGAAWLHTRPGPRPR